MYSQDIECSAQDIPLGKSVARSWKQEPRVGALVLQKGKNITGSDFFLDRQFNFDSLRMGFSPDEPCID